MLLLNNASILELTPGNRYDHLPFANAIAFVFLRLFSSNVVRASFIFNSPSGFLR